MISSQLELHRYALNRQTRVVTAMTLLKSHLFQCAPWPLRSEPAQWCCCLNVLAIIAQHKCTPIARCCSVNGSNDVTSLCHLLPARYQGHVSAALVLGGVDVRGPHLFTVYPHGSTDALPYATMGSGSLNAMAVFENGFRCALCIVHVSGRQRTQRELSPLGLPLGGLLSELGFLAPG